jgi:N utilization substance protein A
VGTVIRRDDRRDGGGYVFDLGKIEGILEEKEQIPGERFKLGQRVRVYVFDLRRGGGRGVQALVSRTHRNIIKRLFELDVPEIYEGLVEIKNIAREPGSRSKVAVWARQESIDPVGACIGVRGTRINNVINELNGEKIDIIQWSPDPAQFVANALSPVKPLNVELRESDHTALVTVPERQLSLAIGKDGQNARLAAKLTGWRVDVVRPAETAAPAGGAPEENPTPA